MATGNLKISRHYCKCCQKNVKTERSGMVWGCGDLILVVLTLGGWCIIRIVFDGVLNPWRCSECGKRI